MGLSPPTRGSLRAKMHHLPLRRSIPAHAGKPVSWSSGARPGKVYPRPRGEAPNGNEIIETAYGLSPPTRGSLPGSRVHGARPRSIPAHAGKPSSSTRGWRTTRVYPRPRGEAASPVRYAIIVRGLSPPTRGSPVCRGVRNVVSGSIPAHAGKPILNWFRSTKNEVYPRPRGEAQKARVHGLRAPGLSPPTRGSRPGLAQCSRGHGSIPAHAGKPVVIGFTTPS